MVFYNSEDIQIPKTKKFLESVYDSKSAQDTHTLYRDWAKSYEEELISNEYVTPFRCAEALDRHLTDKKCNILDLGCGTGLLGRELETLGYNSGDCPESEKIGRSIINIPCNTVPGWEKRLFDILHDIVPLLR